MEILDNSTTSLSNREVLEMLNGCNGGRQKQPNLATIIYETTTYLKSSPAASCSLSQIGEFFDKIKERNYDLSKNERMQIVDLRPQNETELHLIVDNIEEKFTEEQRIDLLELIQTTLQQIPNPEETPAKKKVKLS